MFMFRSRRREDLCPQIGLTSWGRFLRKVCNSQATFSTGSSRMPQQIAASVSGDRSGVPLVASSMRLHTLLNHTGRDALMNLKEYKNIKKRPTILKNEGIGPEANYENATSCSGSQRWREWRDTICVSGCSMNARMLGNPEQRKIKWVANSRRRLSKLEVIHRGLNTATCSTTIGHKLYQCRGSNSPFGYSERLKRSPTRHPTGAEEGAPTVQPTSRASFEAYTRTSMATAASTSKSTLLNHSHPTFYACYLLRSSVEAPSLLP